VGLGLGLGALYYGYPYYGYPYYPYSDSYGDYGYPSDDYPPPPPPPPYPGPDPSAVGGSPEASAGPASGQYWYHCDSPEGYYPYVRNCSHNWQSVPATPAPPPPPNGRN
jgi:hypothetical protein